MSYCASHTWSLNVRGLNDLLNQGKAVGMVEGTHVKHYGQHSNVPCYVVVVVTAVVSTSVGPEREAAVLGTHRRWWDQQWDLKAPPPTPQMPRPQ